MKSGESRTEAALGPSSHGDFRRQSIARPGGPRRLDRTTLAAGVILLFGFVLRLAYAYPVHKYPADADCLNAGERAFRILQGQFPVFYTTVRIGSFECYLHAASFSIFGVSRASLGVATLISGCLLLIVFFLLCRSLLGPTAGCVALLFLAFASPSYLFWTYMPNGYAETMLFSGAALLTGQRLAQGGRRALPPLGFGFASGLAWWNSLQSLGTVVPAAAEAGYRRPEVFRRVRSAMLVAAGFVLGAFPWIAYNIRHSLASFRGNFAARPATGVSQVLSNAAYLVSYRIPDLIATVDPNNVAPPNAVQRLLRVPVLAIDLGALIFAAIAVVSWIRRRVRTGRREAAPGWIVFVAVAAMVCALAVFSEAGQLRGLTSRYILPLYFSAAVLQALFVVWVSRRNRIAAGGIAAILIVFNFAGYALPWTSSRQRLREELRSDQTLLAFLQARRIEAVCGDYWLAYPFNFLSRETIVGLPIHPDADHYRYSERLGPTVRRWALLGRTNEEVVHWARKLGMPGQLTRPAPGYFVFLPTETETSKVAPAAFLLRAREAALAPD